MQFKISILLSALVAMSGCTYHKAMNQQQQRQAILEQNLVTEYEQAAVRIDEKEALQRELNQLQTEISSIDEEITQINNSLGEAKRIDKEQQEMAKKLADLEDKKLRLRKEIEDKRVVIEAM